MSLTAKEQRAILDGDYPALIGIDRFEVGQTLEVTSRVSVRIEKRNLRKGKVFWDYTVIDFRSTFMRRTPLDREPSKPKRRPEEEGGSYEERVAEWRRRRFKPTTSSEIEAARIDGNYTRSHTQAVPESDDVVPPEVQNVFALEARARWSGYMEAERSSEVAEQRAKQLTRRLRRLQADAVKHGVDIAPRLLGMIREAEAEVAKKRAA